MATRSPTRLTPKVRQLVETDRLSRPPVGRLTDAQAKQLVSVVKRPGAFDVPVSAPRALRALAEGAKPAVAVPALKGVLADGRAPRENRIAAARGLGTVATPQAERALLAHLRVRDPRVQQDVLAALGTFGGPAAARALAQLPPPADHSARTQLAFARALIAHRHGLEGPFLRERPALERRPGRGRDASQLSLRLATVKATASARERLRGTTYGIDFADRAYALRCGDAEWTVFLNAEMGRSPKSAVGVFDRPWIAGVLAQALPEREALVTRLVMLTRPAGREAHVDLVRSDGEIVYTGRAQPAGAAIGFAISDVERAATAPLTIKGRATPAGIRVETAVAFGRRERVRSAAPVVV